MMDNIRSKPCEWTSDTETCARRAQTRLQKPEWGKVLCHKHQPDFKEKRRASVNACHARYSTPKTVECTYVGDGVKCTTRAILSKMPEGEIVCAKHRPNRKEEIKEMFRRYRRSEKGKATAKEVRKRSKETKKEIDELVDNILLYSSGSEEE